MAKVKYPIFIKDISGGVGHNAVFVNGQFCNYIRKKGKYTDPKTEDQVAIRDVFSHLTNIAKLVNIPVLKPYTYPRPKGMSAYNRMVHINKPLIDGKVWDFAKLKFFEGSLLPPIVGDPVFWGASEPGWNVGVTFDDNMGSNSKDVTIVFVVIDNISGAVLFTTDRNTFDYISINVGHGPGDGKPVDVNNLHGYLAVIKPPKAGTTEQGAVSNSVYISFKKTRELSSAKDPRAIDQDEIIKSTIFLGRTKPIKPPNAEQNQPDAEPETPDSSSQ